MTIEYNEFVLNLIKVKKSNNFKISGSLFLIMLMIHFGIIFL